MEKAKGRERDRERCAHIRSWTEYSAQKISTLPRAATAASGLNDCLLRYIRSREKPIPLFLFLWAYPIILRPTGRTNFQCHYLAQPPDCYFVLLSSQQQQQQRMKLEVVYRGRGWGKRPFSTCGDCLLHIKREAATLATVLLLLNYKRPVALMDRRCCRRRRRASLRGI